MVFYSTRCHLPSIACLLLPHPLALPPKERSRPVADHCSTGVGAKCVGRRKDRDLHPRRHLGGKLRSQLNRHRLWRRHRHLRHLVELPNRRHRQRHPRQRHQAQLRLQQVRQRHGLARRLLADRVAGRHHQRCLRLAEQRRVLHLPHHPEGLQRQPHHRGLDNGKELHLPRFP